MVEILGVGMRLEVWEGGSPTVADVPRDVQQGSLVAAVVEILLSEYQKRNNCPSVEGQKVVGEKDE